MHGFESVANAFGFTECRVGGVLAGVGLDDLFHQAVDRAAGGGDQVQGFGAVASRP